MSKLAVIIGRFQTPYLHKGHIKLIEEAKSISNDILILIGCTAAVGTDKNPLDFETRKSLFYPHLSKHPILPLHDMPSDKDWSDQIDKIIGDDLGFKEAVIFGGRDSSIEGYYSGKHKIKIIEEHGNHSSTILRQRAGTDPIECPNFRSGIIYHAENRYPIVYSTVDVAIIYHNEHSKEDAILMGRKGDKFNFIGGFVDPQDQDLVGAAERELQEETGFKVSKDVSDLKYKFSHKVEDTRYKNSKDSILTHFFTANTIKEYYPQLSEIQDKEFTEFKWIPANEESLDEIADAHKPLFIKFINSKQ